MAGRVVLCVFLLFCFSEARVAFHYSTTYDEYDFRGQSSITVDALCKDSCHIYASITEESRKLASNILIQTSKGFTSVASLADQKNSSNGQKIGLEISNTPTLTIMNGNPGMSAGPLVLYIVNKQAPNFAGAEVYEAEGLLRPSSMVRAVTLMSARPFTLKQENLDGAGAAKAQSVTSHLTGFDTLVAGSDMCPNLYSLAYAPFPGFEMQINAPIVSLLYDIDQFPTPAGVLSATIGISNNLQLQRSGFFNSPGFHGCAGYDAYRSSLYNYSAPSRVELTSATPQNIVVDIVVSADKLHGVSIADAANRIVDWIPETNPDEPKTFKYFSKNLTVTWEQDGMVFYHYMARYTSTIV